MPLLPELIPMLDRIAASRGDLMDADVPTAERRARIHAGMDQRAAYVSLPAPDTDRHDESIAIPDGEITVRVYRPPTGNKARAVHVYVHGGGWWLGTLDHRDNVCAHRAVALDCVVVSVAPRLAPEFPYPTPVEDVYSAITWVAEHAGELDADPARITVGGDSSGANLVAGAVLMAKDRGGPALLAQVLEIPALDLALSQPAAVENAEGYMQSTAEVADQIAQYCPAERRTEPYASPALAPDLSGLPPTLVLAAEYDVLRDDGDLFVRRLAEAGVPAEFVCWPGHIHGSHEMTKMLPSAQEWQSRANDFLRQHLAAAT